MPEVQGYVPGLPQNLNIQQGLYVSKKVREHLAKDHDITWTENVPWIRQHDASVPTLDNVEFAIVRDTDRAMEVLTEPGSPYVVVKETPTRIFVRIAHQPGKN